jgi:F-type H+-transporting ATPase subunit b
LSLWDVFTAARAWASAAEAEHHAPSINEIWFPLGNFLIFAFIIVRYAFPLVRNFLQSRREEILATVNKAAAKKQHAEAVVKDYQARLARVNQEIQSIQVSLREEGEREKAKLLKEAETLAAKIKEDARFLADQEVKLARQKVRAEMAAQASNAARELVQRNLSAADQARLVEDFIQSIGRVQ